MNRPYVIINAAMSLDGKLATISRRSASLSSEADLRRVLGLRAAVDAVLVGGNTLLQESPKLTVKLPALMAERRARGLPENPAKVGVVSNAALDLDGDFITAGPARRIVFTTTQTAPGQIARLQDAGVEVFVLGDDRVDLPQALETLSTLGIERLMVEGGGTMIFALLELGLVDELRVYIAPVIFGGASAPTLADGAGLPERAAVRLALVDVTQMDAGGLLLQYRVPPPQGTPALVEERAYAIR